MTEAEAWSLWDDPESMLFRLSNRGGHRKPGLFAVACCRRATHLMQNPGNATSVEVAERYAEGCADEEERRAAYEAASAGFWGAFTRPEDHDPNTLASQAVSQLLDGGLDAWDICRAAPASAAEAVAEEAARRGPPESRDTVLRAARSAELRCQCDLLRCVFGNPFRPVTVDPSWLAPAVLTLARQMYEMGDFHAMPILADALQDTGCDEEQSLGHCRGPGPHVRGCWVVDLLLGKV